MIHFEEHKDSGVENLRYLEQEETDEGRGYACEVDTNYLDRFLNYPFVGTVDSVTATAPVSDPVAKDMLENMIPEALARDASTVIGSHSPTGRMEEAAVSAYRKYLGNQ